MLRHHMSAMAPERQNTREGEWVTSLGLIKARKHDRSGRASHGAHQIHSSSHDDTCCGNVTGGPPVTLLVACFFDRARRTTMAMTTAPKHTHLPAHDDVPRWGVAGLSWASVGPVSHSSHIPWLTLQNHGFNPAGAFGCPPAVVARVDKCGIGAAA